MSLHLISAKIFPRPASDERGAFLTTADGAVVEATAEYEVAERGATTTLTLPVHLTFTSKGVIALMKIEVKAQDDVPSAFEKLAEWLERAARGMRDGKLEGSLSLPFGPTDRGLARRGPPDDPAGRHRRTAPERRLGDHLDPPDELLARHPERLGAADGLTNEDAQHHEGTLRTWNQRGNAVEGLIDRGGELVGEPLVLHLFDAHALDRYQAPRSKRSANFRHGGRTPIRHEGPWWLAWLSVVIGVPCGLPRWHRGFSKPERDADGSPESLPDARLTTTDGSSRAEPQVAGNLCRLRGVRERFV